MRQASTATTIAPAHLAAGAVVAAALLVANTYTGAPTWLAVISAALVMVAVIHVATVRLSVGGGRIVLSQGPWPGHGRVIEAESLTAARIVDLGWAQTFGLGAPKRGRITRMSPRPGPALALILRDGEHVIISAPHPRAALALLPTTITEKT